ncbi:hypothetical protein NLG97_g10457 [Lecanicillium saksenae]|uniref:Uncharacterized protein n=1 Tax=Lecanicillium saksenae TaxID=468837 RepID=A0ACC1QD52_9HYPO|nr:hypothetical protein NLG97_g10457 [Lecanicillium saksenae]
MAVERIGSIIKHLAPGSAINAIQAKNADDIVITAALRTPLTKARKGAFKDSGIEYLTYVLLKELKTRSGIDPALVEDFAFGNVNDPLAASKIRAAALSAGFPNTAGAYAVNRFCSSGLKATADIADSIRSGAIEIGIAEVMENQEVQDSLEPMGWTSENVAADFGITREQMDEYAAESFQRAERAQKAGWFDDEIVPIKAKIEDKDGNMKEILVTKDEGIRPGTTKEGLAKVRAAFPQWGETTTGGNASQVTDGGMYS